MTKKFNIANTDIEFGEDFENYNAVRGQFLQFSRQAYDEFIQLYKSNCTNMDEVHNYALDLGYKCIGKNIDAAISILIGNGLMHIDKNSFIENYLMNHLTWEEDFEEVDRKYREIVLTAEQEKEYRQERKDSRGRWQGGGFGLSGAISGAVDAGILNAAGGAAHSIFNGVGNLITSANAESNKKKLFDNPNTIDDLAISVMANVFDIHCAVIDALIENGNNSFSAYPSNKEEEMAVALLNNLKNGLIPKEKESEVIKEIIKNDPYNKDTYVYILKIYGDINKNVKLVTEFLFISMDSDISRIIEEYYNELPKDNESNTLQSLELFKKFAASINAVDISDYLGQFDEILKQHDINIRTIDGILFDTREEAALAGVEYSEIMDIRNGVKANNEDSIQHAINEIEAKNYKTIIQNKYLEELKKQLVEAIRFADQLYLNDNFNAKAIITEEEADVMIEKLQNLELRNMDLVEQRISEFQNKRTEIIRENDKILVEDYFKTKVILDEQDAQRVSNEIMNLEIRTQSAKEEKARFIIERADKIIRKHNDLLQKAEKYEVRINTVKEEPKPEKKGVFGFFAKAIEKGASFIDEIQEKSEKEAWDFITNNGTRTITEVKNKTRL